MDLYFQSLSRYCILYWHWHSALKLKEIYLFYIYRELFLFVLYLLRIIFICFIFTIYWEMLFFVFFCLSQILAYWYSMMREYLRLINFLCVGFFTLDVTSSRMCIMNWLERTNEGMEREIKFSNWSAAGCLLYSICILPTKSLSLLGN